jgi:hypothetical protein
MPEHPPDAPGPDKVHADVDYEKTDARIGPLAGIGVGVLVLALIAYGVSAWVFEAFRARAARKDPGLPPLAAQDRPQLPKDLDKIPPPRLQDYDRPDVKDMDQLRQAEEARLKSYGWTDPQKGKVHIPIDEAMRLLANPEFAKAHGIRVEPADPKGAAKGGKK